METVKYPKRLGKRSGKKFAMSPVSRPLIAAGRDKDDDDDDDDRAGSRDRASVSEHACYHLPPDVKSSEVYTRYLFHTRLQEAEESVDEFVSGLRLLALTCGFGFLHDSLIRDQMVVGVRDARVRRRLLREISLPLKRCIELCREMEAADRHCDDGAEVFKPAGTTQPASKTVSEADSRVEAPQETEEDGLQEAEMDIKPPALHLQQTCPDLPLEAFQAAAEPPLPATDQPASSRPFTCTECSVQLPTFIALQIHTGLLHVKRERNHSPPAEESSFNCSCGQQCTKLQDLLSHVCQVHIEATPGSQAGGSPGGNPDDLTAAEIPAKRARREEAPQTVTPYKVEVLSEEDSEESGVTPVETDMEEDSQEEEEGESSDLLEASASASSETPGHTASEAGGSGHAASTSNPTFSTWAEYMKHQNTLEANRFKCSLCDVGFRTEPLVVDHMTLEHSTHPHFTRIVLCECGMGFPCQELLDSHEAKCKTILCKVCGEEVAKSQIIKHVRKLCNKRYPCYACKEVLSTKAKLQEHVRMHMDREQCPVCKKYVQTYAALKQHLAIHALKRPFICCLCGRPFEEKQQLEEHYTSHGEKLEQCNFCMQHFNSPRCLKNHPRDVASTWPYECSVCGQRFRRFTAMSMHKLKQHRRDRMFRCEVCNRSYVTLGKLQGHWQKHLAPAVNLEGESSVLNSTENDQSKRASLSFKSI